MAKAPRTKVNAGDMLDLTVAVEQLTEETRLLRMSLDELRDDVVWAARQTLASGDAFAPGQLRRQYDPLAQDAPDHEQRDESGIEHVPPDVGESAEDGPYCCDKPQLTWHGDPDMPGIACAHCGYVVAEGGSIVIWRGDDDEDEPSRSAAQTPPPSNPQGTLFSEED